MTLLALSRHVSFHARGDAAFAWHGLTGDVAEMSRDVLALLLAFDPPADDASVAVEGLTGDQVQEFCAVLRSRRFLVQAGAGGRHPDELSPLLAGYPRIPRATVFERTAHGVTLYTRTGEPLPLPPATGQLLLRCDGERTLGQVLGDAGPQALPDLLGLARAHVAALKILAKPVSQGGVHLNPAAESTMPYPELPDARAYARGGPAPEQRPEPEPTFASLFAEPHPGLAGRTYAQAVHDELARRGAFEQGRRVLALGLELPNAEHEPALLGETEAFDAIVLNEYRGGANRVRDAARALRPGGVLFLADFGDPKDPPPNGVRFSDLQAEATAQGLSARVVPLAEALNLDVNDLALSTTKASWPALEALFAAHGIALRRRAWLRREIEQLCDGKIDLSAVHGLLWAPLSERALGLSPRQFWALLAKKPARVLH